MTGQVKVIIAGGRDFNDPDFLEETMQVLFLDRFDHGDLTIISGGAPGADKLGEEWANEFNICIAPFPVSPAEWKKYGKSAGPRRNKRMAEYAAEGPWCGNLVAFWNGETPGTKSMIKYALNFGLQTHVMRY